MKRTLLLSTLALSAFASNAQVIFSEGFETASAGSYVALSFPLHWSTWSASPGGPEDGVVSNTYAHSGLNSAKVLQTAAGGGPVDMLLLLGDSTQGNYLLSWYMYVPAGKGGYFNIQHFQDDPGAEYAAEFNFLTDGTVTGAANGDPVSGVYPQGEWFNVAIVLDLNSASASLLIDLAPITTWPFDTQSDGTAGTNQIGSIDFFAYAGAATGTDGEYYIDDVAFSSIPSSINEIDGASISTFPNPAGDQLFIDLPLGTNNPVAELLDASGREVARSSRYSNLGEALRMEMDLRAVPVGVYTLRVNNGDQPLVRKVVKN